MSNCVGAEPGVGCLSKPLAWRLGAWSGRLAALAAIPLAKKSQGTSPALSRSHRRDSDSSRLYLQSVYQLGTICFGLP
jgi:hypothetical protein